MTTEQKKTSMTVAGLVGALGLILGLWPQLVGVIEWVESKEWASAIISGVVASFFAGMLLPNVLPGHWPQGRTRFVWGLTVAAVAAGAVYWMLPTTNGMFHAAVSAAAAPTVVQALMGGVYALFPRLKPESLQP